MIVSDYSPLAQADPQGNDDKMSDLQALQAKLGFTLQRMPYGATLAGLQAAIKNASNQGAKFRRIIILSHAGGERDSPSASLQSEKDDPFHNARLHAGTLRPSLAKQINASLTPNGILVIATCGYYYEEATRGYVKPYRTRDPVNNPADARYQSNWMKALAKMAGLINHAVAADSVDSKPSKYAEDAGSYRYRTADEIPGPNAPRNVPRIMVGPDGKILTPNITDPRIP